MQGSQGFSSPDQAVWHHLTPDISILLLYTFHQEVFYASHNQSYPSVNEERTAFWVGFVSMLVMPSLTSSWMLKLGKSSTDLL